MMNDKTYTDNMVERATAETAKSAMKAVRDPNPFSALGRAVSYMMTKPAFANLKFGHWSRTLTGQINRNHYFFIVQNKNVCGFIGWAMTSEQNADAWADAGASIDSKDGANGDCLVVNAWAADDDAVMAFSLQEAKRQIPRQAKRIYFKRFYKDGRVRVSRLDASKFVGKAVRAETPAQPSTSPVRAKDDASFAPKNGQHAPTTAY
ncbi:MAG: toxin-activating lysine-acyltransferase [Pseudomonadota bacterium]